MAKAKWKPAYKVVRKYEGGYTNDPDDPGGPTNHGIIQRVYDGFRRGRGEPTRGVRQITEAEVLAIYKRQYWDAVKGDRLPAGVDLAMYDGAVNSGPSQAVKWLQRALRMNRIDGDLGEATLAAVNAHPDHDALIAEICRRRLGMLKTLKHWKKFGKGWSKRVASTMAIGQAWASGSVGPEPVEVEAEGGNAKGSVADVALPPAPEEAGVNTGAGGGALSGTVAGAQEKLEPLVGTSDTLDLIYAFVIAAGIAIAVGGAVYYFWAKRKRRAAERAWSGEATADVDPLMEGQPA